MSEIDLKGVTEEFLKVANEMGWYQVKNGRETSIFVMAPAPFDQAVGVIVDDVGLKKLVVQREAKRLVYNRDWNAPNPRFAEQALTNLIGMKNVIGEGLGK